MRLLTLVCFGTCGLLLLVSLNPVPVRYVSTSLRHRPDEFSVLPPR